MLTILWVFYLIIYIIIYPIGTQISYCSKYNTKLEAEEMAQ